MFLIKRGHVLEELNGKMNALHKEFQLLKSEMKDLPPTPEPPAAAPDPRLSEMVEAVQDVGARLDRQSSSLSGLTDLLDELRRRQSLEAEESGRQKEWEERERALLEWAALEREQLRLLRNAILGDSGLTRQARSAWRNQFSMLEDDGAKAMALCGVQEIGTEGERFDPAIHEILQELDAPERRLDGIVAQIYRPALLYCGKLVQKAKVTVYRWNEPEAGGVSPEPAP